jgi:hypothetical protein
MSSNDMSYNAILSHVYCMGVNERVARKSVWGVIAQKASVLLQLVGEIPRD